MLAGISEPSTVPSCPNQKKIEIKSRPGDSIRDLLIPQLEVTNIAL